MGVAQMVYITPIAYIWQHGISAFIDVQLSSNVHPRCGRRGPHANASRPRRAGILPALARQVQRRMELSRFALRIFIHTTLSRSLEERK